MNSDNPRLRLSILGIVVFSLFAGLFARLWYLQVMVSDQFQVAAEANRIRVVAVEAPRGRILDRNGTVIVANRVSVQVTIDRSKLDALAKPERVAVLTKVANALSSTSAPKTVDQLEERIADQRFSPYIPVPVASDVPEDLKIWIDEHSDELPSVAAQRVAVRDYPFGRLAAHVIGYTGKITKDELDTRTPEIKKDKPYTLNDEIGKAGIERQYENVLRGKPGLRTLEVDASGDPVRVISDKPPVAGDDVVLNLDVNIQAATEQALKSGLDAAGKRNCLGCAGSAVGAVGSTVVIEPTSGGVVAMASFPNFEPADYTDGISQSEWAFLNDPVNHFPLNNWALQGQYAPGSTLKPFTAVAGLTAGLITPEKTIYDDGVYEVPGCKGDSCKFRNDNSKAYQTVNLRRSLTVSSDFYYYDIGAHFWIDQDRLGGPERFADLLKEWGFDKRTGIDLPSEQPGRIPSPAWLAQYCSHVTCSDDSSHWRTGKNVNMAIGQGEDLVTPLQLASAYATMANGGTRWKPQMVREIRVGQTAEVRKAFTPEAVGSVDMQPAWRQTILEGLVGVTTQDGGTAVGAFQGFPNADYPIAAKTGTAQVSHKAPTAVFGAFGPAPAPAYAISVMMEESGYGGSAAAPVARRIFDVLSGFKPAPAASDAASTAADVNLLPNPGDVRD